ncbi:MAG TPA: CapA family protein [Candidatus Saccharimonadales bacterium]|nr:CapA family protein [Candidatus Saccharimonadales bacterium]
MKRGDSGLYDTLGGENPGAAEDNNTQKELPAGNRRKKLIIAAALLLVVIGGGAAYALTRDNTKTAVTSQSPAPAPEPASPQPQSIEGKYLISGTMVFDRLTDTDAGSDLTQPFRYFDTLGTYDTMIADLECPITSSSYHSVKGQDNPRFNCSPKWIPELKKYFGVIKLAGNHTYDMGADGFTETVKRLQDAGIQTVGHYNPHIDKDNCRIVGLPVRVENSDKKVSKATLPVAICAFNYKILFAPEPGEIEAIQKYAKIMPVFGLLQSGAEYIYTATPEKIKYARQMIDNGADFVIGNGAHGVQNSEVYKDKLIIYSLGNFVFDQVDPETTRGLSMAVTASAKYDDNLSKWLALGSKCDITARDDDCLKTAQDEGLSKIDLKLKFQPVVTSGGAHKITKRADAAQQKAIEQRLNWAALAKQFGQ